MRTPQRMRMYDLLQIYRNQKSRTTNSSHPVVANILVVLLLGILSDSKESCGASTYFKYFNPVKILNRTLLGCLFQIVTGI